MHDIEEKGHALEKAFSQDFDQVSNNSARIPRLENPDNDNANKSNFINYSFDNDPFSKNINSSGNSNDYKVNKKVFADEIKMMHEFIEFKYFKKVMKQNNNIFE